MIKVQKKFCYVGRITEEIKKYYKLNKIIEYVYYTIIFLNCKVFFEFLSLQKYYGYKRKNTK